LLIGSFFTPTIGISINNDTTPPVKNNENYLFDTLIILDDFHDVGIKSITSPSNPFNKFKSFSPTNPEVYIQPGTEDIDVIVENNGTFPEYNLTCFAKIYEFITDPENGTLVYEDEITGIDLEEPNGGTKLLNFKSNTFPDEGLYSLCIDLPLEIDDFPENNQRELNIGVDDTDPVSDYPPIFYPPEPNGENGWYVSDVTVTLSATDPFSNGVSSGVREIRYTINGGAEGFIPGDNGSLILSESGDDILVEYWAIDNVGNVESPKNSFTIDIDKNKPEIQLTYEIVGGSPLHGWDLEIIITSTDAMSGVALLLIFLNDELIKIFQGSGPEYVWTLRYKPPQNIVIKIIVCDYAGNYAVQIFNLSDIDLNRHSKDNFFNKLSQNLFFNWLIDRFFLLEVFL
jgi:hypothetical protein